MQDAKRRICIIGGDHGIGKSTLAAFYIISWYFRQEILKNFNLVTLISLKENEVVDCKNFTQLIFPWSSELLGKNCLEDTVDLLQNDFKMLVLFDDIDTLDDLAMKKLLKLLQNAPNSCYFIGFSSFSAICKNFSSDLDCQQVAFLQLRGLKDEKILELSQTWTCSENQERICLRAKLKENMTRFGRLLKYPLLLREICDLWLDCPGYLKETHTVSDLVWELLVWKVKRNLKINLRQKGSGRKKFFQWLLSCGEASLSCLKLNKGLDSLCVQDLNLELKDLFSDKELESFLNSIFRSRICHSRYSCLDHPSSTNLPFLQYCSSWFIMDQLLTANKSLSKLIPVSETGDILPVILFCAGHLERLQEDMSIQEQRRLIKCLVHYREGSSYDDFSFLQQFVAELKCIKRFVEIVIDESEYDEEWTLDMTSIQQRSLEVLLTHVSPTRLIFVSDKPGIKNYELDSVMNYVRKVNISVWLDSIWQFNFGNRENLDKLLKPFLDERVIPRLDLISGSLSPNLMKELPTSKATTHLRFLRLQVTDEKQLMTALKLPPKLPNLLWLELKIDGNFALQNTDRKWPKANVQLFDVHLKGLGDFCVSEIVDFLSVINDRYTGIHLEDTSLTPESVFALLKELRKRGIYLQAKTASIAKFRCWYYPSLSNFDPESIMKFSDTDIEKLIGHDDRSFYTDHCVRSNRFVRTLDAWNLRNFLQTERTILQFVYEASNIIFKKQINGEVEVSFKGDYKEAIEEKMDPTEKSANIIDLC